MPKVLLPYKTTTGTRIPIEIDYGDMKILQNQRALEG